MLRIGSILLLGLLLSPPLLAEEAGNSLLVPATARCTLTVSAEQLEAALAGCQQLAESGDAQAQYELGEFFYERVPQDLPAALHWFEKATLLGNAKAQLHLGNMFFHGEGVTANRVQAYILLKMAAVNGAEDALDSADLVAEQMSKEELDRASRVLGQIFRDYLMELQTDSTPFTPLP